MGYVYLLHQFDTDGLEKHKIGISKRDPNIRVKELATGNPNKITLLKYYASTNYLKIEKWMHRKYGYLKTEAKNEWRLLSDEQVMGFLDDCKEADDNFNFLLKNNSLFD